MGKIITFTESFCRKYFYSVFSIPEDHLLKNMLLFRNWIYSFMVFLIFQDIMDDSTYKEQLKTQKDKSRNLKDNPSSNSGSNNLLGGANLFGGLGAGLGGGLAAGLGAGLGGGLGGLGGGLGGLGGINNLLGAQVGAQQTSYLQLLSMLNSKGGEPINSTVFVSNVSNFFPIILLYVKFLISCMQWMFLESHSKKRNERKKKGLQKQ